MSHRFFGEARIQWTVCKLAGVRPLMSSVGDRFDNALCESFFAALECELVLRGHFSNYPQARLAVCDFIEGLTNPHRRHSAIGYLAPISFERRNTSETTAFKQPSLH